MLQVLSLLRPELGLYASSNEGLLSHYALLGAQRFCRESRLWSAVTYDGPVPGNCVLRLRPAETSVVSLYAGARIDAAFGAGDFGDAAHGQQVAVPAFTAPSHLAIAYPAGRTVQSVTNDAVGGGDTELIDMFESGPHVVLDGGDYETLVSKQTWFAYVSGTTFSVALTAAGDVAETGVPGGATIWEIGAVTRTDLDSPEPVGAAAWDPATGELTLDHCRAETVQVRAILEPLTDATELPAHFRRWRSAIVDAALVELLAMPRMDWHDPRGSMVREASYLRHLRQALSTGLRRYVGRPRVVAPYDLA